jgi:hypothetical protein
MLDFRASKGDNNRNNTVLSAEFAPSFKSMEAQATGGGKVAARRFVCIGVVTVLAVGAGVQAAPLGLTLYTPDISSGFVSVSYDAGAEVFSASGYAFTLDFDGLAPPDEDIIAGTFDISLPVGSSGTITPGVGSLAIEGSVQSSGPSLLLGEIAAFGFLDDGGEIFEFLFTVTGGDLAGSFDPTVGVILDASDSGFSGTFSCSFSNSGFGVSDTANIPEPATLSLLFGGLALTVAHRRRRN